MDSIEINPQFEQVLNFINHTSRSVFLTGKAGTGKTTLLKYIRKNTFKQMAVVAPTGVAAINAGGSTIHSFFQFPFTPFLPLLKEDGQVDYTKNNLPTLKYNSQRLAIFRNLELLVIDEVSMVRADLLDQIDITLRQTRRKWQQPFGGVQVFLIGDLYQLPPVVQQGEWQLMSDRYNSPFFFESLVIKNNPLAYIELEKIYRQNELSFIELLYKVRNNDLDEGSIKKLNERYRANLGLKDYADSITLTTHNKNPDEINEQNLNAIVGEVFTYKCKIEGVFSEKNFPADEKLSLKTGTRVMFLKNNPEKNYYNGKTGIVTFLSKDKILVKCPEDKQEIEVSREVWTNVSYQLNKQTKHVEEEILGTFSQYPLRLAWAITIHKSQGLTFDRLIIDAAESFSAGQVYVALSRCRSLEGIIFSSAISQKSLLSDTHVIGFAANKQSSEQLQSVYSESRLEYLSSILLNLFDFTEFLTMRGNAAALIHLHNKRFSAAGILWSQHFFDALESLAAVSSKFRNQLLQLSQGSPNPETNPALQQRVSQASAYFAPELDKLILQLKNHELLTESKEAADEINAGLQELFEALYSRLMLIKSCASGFNLNHYTKQKLGIVYPDVKINIYATAKKMKAPADVKYPDLYRSLLLLRDEICNDEHKPIYMVASNKTIVELANYLPVNSEYLLKISGFGEAKVEAWGDRFIGIIKDYVAQHQLEPDTDLLAVRKAKNKKSKKKTGDDENSITEKKPDSKNQSFLLFKQGLKPSEIARQRGFSVSTIEGHLVSFVGNGDIKLDDLVDSAKQKIIREALLSFKPETGLNPVKAKLPPEITFSEIKFVLAAKLTGHN